MKDVIYLLVGLLLGMIIEGMMRRKQLPITAQQIAKELIDIDLSPFITLPNQAGDPHADPTFGSVMRTIELAGRVVCETKDSNVFTDELKLIEGDHNNFGKRLRIYMGEELHIDTIVKDYRNASDIQ
jgi:hypothetical protein